MNATERFTILITPDQKKQLAGLAAEAEMSISQYVRQRALESDGEIDLLTEQVNQAADAAEASLAMLKEQVIDLDAAEAAARDRAAEEFAHIDPARFADLIQPVKSAE